MANLKHYLKGKKMINIHNLDLSQCPTHVELALKAAMDLGFKGEFDSILMEGKLKLDGIEATFSVGDENLYFSVCGAFVKNSATEGLNALAQFSKVFANYGGQRLRTR